FRLYFVFFFSSRRRHTISKRDWSSDVCSSDLKFEDGKITPLDPAPEITTDTLRDTHRIVAMMGPEPFQEAVTNGADVVLAGRASDAGLMAAIPLMKGIHPGLAWHAAKIVECGGAAVTQMIKPEGM